MKPENNKEMTEFIMDNLESGSYLVSDALSKKVPLRKRIANNIKYYWQNGYYLLIQKVANIYFNIKKRKHEK